MKGDKFRKEIEDGKLRVQLYDEGYGLQLSVRTNGWQSSECGVNEDLVDMLITLLTSYKEGGTPPNK